MFGGSLSTQANESRRRNPSRDELHLGKTSRGRLEDVAVRILLPKHSPSQSRVLIYKGELNNKYRMVSINNVIEKAPLLKYLRERRRIVKQREENRRKYVYNKGVVGEPEQQRMAGLRAKLETYDAIINYIELL